MSLNFQLISRIVDLSESDNWQEAKKEWMHTQTYYISPEEEAATCLCGHFPVRECCIISNKINGSDTLVGNCCIKKFMDTEASLIFQCIKRLIKNRCASLNPATILYAREKGIIDTWEKNFYMDIRQKRKLTEKQQTIKSRINETVLRGLVRRHREGDSKKKTTGKGSELFDF